MMMIINKRAEGNDANTTVSHQYAPLVNFYYAT